MKFNKWTLGLAAIGVVSLASVARADEKVSSLQTALSNTTISGYVSASFNWAISPGGNLQSGSPAGYIPFQQSKQDGFNLDVVKLSIAKPEDESPWASGYQVDLLVGPDANGYNTAFGSISGAQNSSDIGIKQAFVTLRTPVGNGIDWKFGVFDTVIGYEVTDAGSNPNYTRSWGYNIEPTEHTGVLASYKINDEFSVSAGVANTLVAGINSRAYDYSASADGFVANDWHKTLMGSVTFTAPSSWGWAAGSSIYAGVVWGFNGGNDYGSKGYNADGNQANYYAGATLNTPWKQFTAGVAFDYAQNINGGGADFASQWHNDIAVFGVYGTYKATDKLSFNGRAEYIHGQYEQDGVGAGGYSSEAFEFTGTVEYDLWANVMTRLEARWDHFGSHDTAYALYDSGTVNRQDAVGLYANIIYKF
jgi:hypothetical protein